MLFLVGAGAVVGITISFSLVFFIAGWITSSLYFKKKMESNPPITEELIRGVYSQLGKKLSETQLLRIMNNLKKAR